MKALLFKKTKLMFVSPWLLAAAIGLLSLIIVVFAANNIKRERGMLSEGLFRKGEAIIRFVEAGMRASMMGGVMGGMMGKDIPDTAGAAQTQRLIEQAAEALRLSRNRFEAGSGTQLEVLESRIQNNT